MSTWHLESPDKLLDETGWHILQELQNDARISFAELGRRVGLSAPAVQERVRRLEDAGIIEGYHAKVNLEKIGISLMAMVRMGNACGREAFILKHLRETPEVLECHHVLGEDCFIIKLAVPNVKVLERILGLWSAQFAPTTTTLVLSTPIERNVVERAILGDETNSELYALPPR